MPDHERGYRRRDAGVLPPDPEMAENYERRANFDPVVFTPEHQEIIIQTAIEVCKKRDWRLHYCVSVDSHVHPLVSWRDDQIEFDFVYERLKQAMGYALAKHFNAKGRPNFARGGGEDRKQVADEEHFERLMTKYLPDHFGATFSERMK